ncbi:MAG: YfhO family protein, partial [Methanoregula sp.]|nr:YfhO family protein [Methanoregula sp.]
ISVGSPISQGKSVTFSNDSRYITIISYTANSIILHTNSTSSQYLILTDTFDNRWKAYVDGIGVPVTRTNYLFRGVRVPEGQHSINFAYEYPEFNLYLLLSILIAVGITIYIFYLRLYKSPQ